MKKWISISLAMILALGLLCGAVWADTSYVTDQAGLLSQSDRNILNDRAARVSDAYACTVAILTVDSIGGAAAGTYAEDYFDQNGLGYHGTNDGIFLVVSMAERDYAVTAAGIGELAVAGYRMDDLEDAFLGYLSDGDYYMAFDAFIAKCDYLLAHPADSVSYDSGTRAAASSPARTVLVVVLALGLGFLFSLIPLGVMKSKNNNVAKNAAASNYMRPGSLQLYRQDDRYVRTDTTRVRIENNNGSRGMGGGSHTSSSGVSHTTSSGKF